MIALMIFGWWLSGFVTMAFLSPNGWDGFTWGDLFRCFLLGWFGLILALAIGITIGGRALADAEFWNKPIFGKRSKKP